MHFVDNVYTSTPELPELTGPSLFHLPCAEMVSSFKVYGSFLARVMAAKKKVGTRAVFGPQCPSRLQSSTNMDFGLLLGLDFRSEGYFHDVLVWLMGHTCAWHPHPPISPCLHCIVHSIWCFGR